MVKTPDYCVFDSNPARLFADIRNMVDPKEKVAAVKSRLENFLINNIDSGAHPYYLLASTSLAIQVLGSVLFPSHSNIYQFTEVLKLIDPNMPVLDMTASLAIRLMRDYSPVGCLLTGEVLTWKLQEELVLLNPHWLFSRFREVFDEQFNKLASVDGYLRLII